MIWIFYISSTWDYITFEVFFFNVKKKEVFQKLAGLWLVGEVVNHVGFYGSKVAEGCSAFQRRSCTTLSSLVAYIVITTTCGDTSDDNCQAEDLLSLVDQWASVIHLEHISTMELEQKWQTFCRILFEMNFCEWKLPNLKWDLIQICS